MLLAIGSPISTVLTDFFSFLDLEVSCSTFFAGETVAFGASLDCAETVIAPTAKAAAKITLMFIFTRSYRNRTKRGLLLLLPAFTKDSPALDKLPNRNRTCGNEGIKSKIRYRFEIFLQLTLGKLEIVNPPTYAG